MRLLSCRGQRPAAALLLLALVAGPASAQYRGADNVRFRPAAPAQTGIAVGPLTLANQFEYSGLDRTAVPAQERTGLGVQLTGEAVRLTVGYVGTETAEPGLSEIRGRSALAALEVGSAWSPLSTGDSLRIGLLVPITLGLGYEYLEPPQPADGTDGPDAFHVGRVGLGLGLGLEAGALVEGSALSEVIGRASLTARPGVLSDFSDTPFEDTFGQRTTVLDLDVRVLGIAGSGVGVVFGYTRHDVRRSAAPLEKAADVLDAIGASDFVEQSRSGILRFGVVF